jgi:hypothetical protein
LEILDLAPDGPRWRGRYFKPGSPQGQRISVKFLWGNTFHQLGL